VKKIFLLILANCAFLWTAQAQFNASFEGNGQWYSELSESGLHSINDDSTRFRSNAYLKLDYAVQNWDFGLQIESYLPKALLNYSPDLDGVNIGTIHARYHNSAIGLDITGGHLYEQFGNGLIFRTWEDRQLGINNAILGGRVAYTPISWATLTTLAGKQRIGMGFDLSNGAIFGANLDISITDMLSVDNYTIDGGFSYLGRHEKAPTAIPQNPVDTTAPSMVNAYSCRINFAVNGFYFGGEYVFKGKDVAVEALLGRHPELYTGQALYINFGYSLKGLGIDVILRRMENMKFYSQRDEYGNQYNTAILNYLPALTKQYDYSLQNIYIYQAQSALSFMSSKAGEIGGQIDVIYEFKKGTALGGKYGMNIALNASYWAALQSAFAPVGAYTYTSDFLAFGDKLYNDIGVEVRKKCSDSWSFIAMYLNQFYNKGYLEIENVNISKINANTFAGETTYKFGKAQAVKLELQHQWGTEMTKEDVYGIGVYKNVSRNKNWWGAGIEYTLNHHWSVYVNDTYNYQGKEDDKDYQKHYYNVGITFVQSATRIALGFGRQRGGLHCSGGVCRQVPEATGLTLNITTSF
jgi:hypothetical protein